MSIPPCLATIAGTWTCHRVDTDHFREADPREFPKESERQTYTPFLSFVKLSAGFFGELDQFGVVDSTHIGERGEFVGWDLAADSRRHRQKQGGPDQHQVAGMKLSFKPPDALVIIRVLMPKRCITRIGR